MPVYPGALRLARFSFQIRLKWWEGCSHQVEVKARRLGKSNLRRRGPTSESPAIRQVNTAQEFSIPHCAVRKVFSKAAKPRSKFSREAAAVAHRSAVATPLLEVHGNTPEFLDYSFQLLSGPYFHGRIVKMAVRCRSVG